MKCYINFLCLLDLIPGREQMGISICIGKIPLKYIDQHPKRLYIHLLAFLIFVILHIAFWLLKIVMKQCSKKRYNQFQSYRSKWKNVFNTKVIHFQIIQLVGSTSAVPNLVPAGIFLPAKPFSNAHKIFFQTFFIQIIL